MSTVSSVGVCEKEHIRQIKVHTKIVVHKPAVLFGVKHL